MKWFIYGLFTISKNTTKKGILAKLACSHKGYFLNTLEMRGFHMVYLELLFKIY